MVIYKTRRCRIAHEACNQHCKLHEGEYGVCGIRKVENGELLCIK